MNSLPMTATEIQRLRASFNRVYQPRMDRLLRQFTASFMAALMEKVETLINKGKTG